MAEKNERPEEWLQLAQKCPHCGDWLLKGQLITQFGDFDYHLDCVEAARRAKIKSGKSTG